MQGGRARGHKARGRPSMAQRGANCRTDMVIVVENQCPLKILTNNFLSKKLYRKFESVMRKLLFGEVLWSMLSTKSCNVKNVCTESHNV